MNMEKIMQRFKIFNHVAVSNNSEEEDTAKEEAEQEDEQEEEEEEQQKIDVELPSIQKVDSKFSDAGFWKVEGLEDDLDSILADYE